jgi:signal transduction histidine kinase
LLFWVIAFIALKGDYKNPTNRFFSATAFFSGSGGIPVVWRENILTNYSFGGSELSIINYIMAIISTFPYYIAPYCFLMLGIIYSNIVPYKFVKIIKLVFLIPTILMYMIFPIEQTFQTSFQVLCIWVVPYIVFSNILIFLAFVREKVPAIKQHKLYISILTMPVTMYALVSSYIVPALGGDGWRYNIYITIFQFVAFIYILANHGIMGAKLKFEKNTMDTTMKAITSGNALLNHTIKNQISKIMMSLNNLNESIKEKDIEVLESIDVISKSTNHMLEMVTRIHEKTSDIILKEDYHSLINSIEEVLSMLEDNLMEKRITLTKNFDNCDIVLYSDIIHFKEMVFNILKNSIEALDIGGEITIAIYQNKKWIFIEIKDNGKGIPKEYIGQVIQPYFTTKSNQTLNFGLGLSYCYNAMIKHDGFLEIKSRLNLGTSVYLKFPQKRALSSNFKVKNMQKAFGG